MHLGGTFRFTRAAAGHFRRHGRVVNVTSYSGLHGNVGQANYGGGQERIIGLTKMSPRSSPGSVSP